MTTSASLSRRGAQPTSTRPSRAGVDEWKPHGVAIGQAAHTTTGDGLRTRAQYRRVSARSTTGRCPTTVGINFLLRATEMRGAQIGVRTHLRWQRQSVRPRPFAPAQGAGGMPVHIYDDLSKFEVSFGEFSSAKKAACLSRGLDPRTPCHRPPGQLTDDRRVRQRSLGCCST